MRENELSTEIIGAAIEVHNSPENRYQTCCSQPIKLSALCASAVHLRSKHDQ